MKIPLMDLQRQYETIKSEIDPVVQKVLTTAVFIGGPERENFEIEYAKAVGAKYCIGVGNGTDAIFIALKALGVGLGDEVITAANSFIASSEAAAVVGAKARFVDVDPKTFLMDLQQLEEMLKKHSHKNGGKVKALIPVHLYGRIANMPEIMRIANAHDVFVIEDTAQAHLATIEGRQAGTWGHFGTYSFYPGKNLGAYGDAGAIVTNDEKLAMMARKVANHGRTKKYDHDMEGFNSRLDALQAAILRVKLKHLPAWTKARQEKAKMYTELLTGTAGITLPEIPPGDQHVFHLYVIRLKNRDQVLEKMKAKGVEASIHYPIALPFLDAYKHLGHTEKDFPASAMLQKEILSLPLFPEMTKAEVEFVVQTLKESL
jgi:dTDP-4-amino-4,6-dideoxygalactose transaminase